MKPTTSAAYDAEPKHFEATGSPWTPEQLLSNLQGIDRATSANIIRLFDEDNTIPFICRYRRELTGNMDPDRWVSVVRGANGFQLIIICLLFFRLRDIKVTYNHIKNIQSRAETIIKDLAKKNVLTDDVRQDIVAAKSLDELDHLVSAISERALEHSNEQ